MPDLAALLPLIGYGFLLGWSVAWPPGPINAEIVRRGLSRGFGAAASLWLGASSGDALWALAVALGAGLLLTTSGAKFALALISPALLLLLGGFFLIGAWRSLRQRDAPSAEPNRFDRRGAGYLLGLAMALTSPWNIAFWFAVMGRPEALQYGLAGALVVALAVIAGAVSWCILLTSAVVLLRLRFATGYFEVVAKAATGLLMLYFAAGNIARLALT